MKLRDGTIWILQPILYPGFQPMASYSTIVKSGLDVGERDLTTLSTDFISKPGNAAYLTNDQTEAIGILKNSYEVSRQQLINNLKVNNSIAKNQMNFALQCNRVRSQHQTKKAKKWHDSPLHASQIGLIDYYLDNRQSILNRNIAWSGAVKIIKNIKALLPENMHTLFPKLNFKLPYRINVEDLSWSKSKSNIPNAERHSQWVRGQLIRYIQELAVLEGIGCMKISARYTSQVCCKCGQLGEKGFLYHNFGMGEILHGSDLIDGQNEHDILISPSVEDVPGYLSEYYCKENGVRIGSSDWYWLLHKGGNLFRCVNEKCDYYLHFIGRDWNAAHVIRDYNFFKRKWDIYAASLEKGKGDSRSHYTVIARSNLVKIYDAVSAIIEKFEASSDSNDFVSNFYLVIQWNALPKDYQEKIVMALSEGDAETPNIIKRFPCGLLCFQAVDSMVKLKERDDYKIIKKIVQNFDIARLKIPKKRQLSDSLSIKNALKVKDHIETNLGKIIKSLGFPDTEIYRHVGIALCENLAKSKTVEVLRNKTCQRFKEMLKTYKWEPSEDWLEFLEKLLHYIQTLTL